MNGHANCIYAVCCPPDSDGQIQALANEISAAFPVLAPESSPVAIAAWVLKNFDLAPKGSLQSFKDAIRDLAREGYAKVNLAGEREPYPGLHNEPGD